MALIVGINIYRLFKGIRPHIRWQLINEHQEIVFRRVTRKFANPNQSSPSDNTTASRSDKQTFASPYHQGHTLYISMRATFLRIPSSPYLLRPIRIQDTPKNKYGKKKSITRAIFLGMLYTHPHFWFLIEVGDIHYV